MRNKNFCRFIKEIGKKQPVSFQLLTNCTIFAARIDIEKHYGRNNQESIYQVRPKRFIRFNYELYKHNPYSVLDLYDDILNTFNKWKNLAFEFCEADHFLAYKDGQAEFKIYIPDIIPEKHKRISEFVKCKYNR